MFEIYTMVSEIHDTVKLVLDEKTFVELEIEICLRELKYKSLNRSVPVLPVHKGMMKSKEKKHMKVEAPF